MMDNDMQRHIDALHAIPADVDRDTWVRVGMAAKSVGIDFDAFDQWSQTAPDVYDARACRDTWRSLKDGPAGVGVGTLHHLAAKYGRAGGGRVRSGHDHKRHNDTRAGTGTPKHGASEVWARCVPAPPSHPYIVGKNAEGVPLDDLRVVPEGDALRIAGERMAGALVVPCRGANGQLASLQFVTTGDTAARLKAAGKPTKLNLPGHSMDGWHVVGTPTPNRPIHICEGIGQAWTVWRATGDAAVVSFGWGNVSRVSRHITTQDPDTTVVLVPDMGKETESDKLATELGALVVKMPDGFERNADVFDLEVRDGLETVAELLASASKPAFKLPLGVSFADDLGDTFEPPDELVEGVLTAGAGSILYGDSNSGKTFLAIDMACAVARGMDWHGRKVEPGLVVYLAAESPASVKGRLQAYQRTHGCKVPNFAIIERPVNLFEGDMDELVLTIKAIERQAGKKVALVIGDTLARLTAGANENSGEDMGVVVRNFDYIRAETGAHFMLIHHSGKDAAKGARGHSSLRAAVDTEIEVTDTPQGRCAEITKQRDLGTKGVRIGFRLDVVQLGETKWGKPATSCVVSPVDAPEKQVKGRRMGEVEGAIVEYLAQLKIGVRKADIARHFDGRYDRSNVYRALRALVSAHAVHEAAGMVVIAEVAKGDGG